MKTGKTAVILTYPGIGDIVWHIPFFQGLAQKADNKKIYLYSRKTTHAKEILKYDKSIAKVSYLKETRQFINTLKTFPNLIKNLRKERFTTLWIFHRSPRFAIISFFSSVKERLGYGIGSQRIWLSNSNFLNKKFYNSFPIEKSFEFLKINNIFLNSVEPKLKASELKRNQIKKKYKKPACCKV